MLKMFSKLISVLFIFGMNISSPVEARFDVDIKQGGISPIPIAVANFVGGSSDMDALGQQISQVINSNLSQCIRFKVIDQKAFVQNNHDIFHQINYQAWRVLKLDALVSGKITQDPNQPDKISVELHLYDIPSGRIIDSHVWTYSKSYWRHLAHKISDSVYKLLTGKEGYFATRIAYISETGPLKNRTRRLAIMDQDGFNTKYLTDGRQGCMTPRFSYDGNKLTYFKFINYNTYVHVMDLRTGEDHSIGTFEGMSFAPRFSPDGQKLIFSLTKGAATLLYTIDLTSRTLRPLTQTPFIDTSPCYSPDGSKIAFISDRSGTPQVYVMNSDGSDMKRISFGKGRYYTPVWSPSGNLIAYAKSFKGQFFIGIMRPDGSGERVLSEGWVVEEPSFSPDGEMVVYSKRSPSNRNGTGGRARVYTVHTSGYGEREIQTPTDATHGVWSPLLP